MARKVKSKAFYNVLERSEKSPKSIDYKTPLARTKKIKNRKSYCYLANFLGLWLKVQ